MKIFRLRNNCDSSDNFGGKHDGLKILEQRVQKLESEQQLRERSRLLERLRRYEDANKYATVVTRANKESVDRANNVLERTKRELIAANMGDAMLERGYRSTPELKNVVLWKDSELLWKGSEHLPEENPAEFISSVAQMGGSDKKTVREKIQKMLSWKKKTLLADKQRKKEVLRKGLTSIPDREDEAQNPY